MNISEINSRIDTAIRFFLYLMILAIPFSKAMIEVSVVAASILWWSKRGLIFAHLRRGNGKNWLDDFIKAFSFPASALSPAISGFLALCGVSMIWSFMPERSMHGFFTKTLEWFAVYFLVLEVFTQRKYILTAVGLFLLTTIVTGIDAVLQYYWLGQDLFNKRALIDGYRATAGFVHPNMLGAYLTIAIPITVSFLFFKSLDWKRRVAVVFLLALLSLALLLTFSRGAWMGVAIGILFLMSSILFYRAKLKLWNHRNLIILGLVLILLAGGRALEWREKSNIRANDAATVAWRIKLWEASLEMIKDRPVFGYGLNTYMPAMETFLKTTQSVWSISYSASYAHNCYLQVAVEVGIAGMLAFIAIFFALFRQVWRPYDPMSPGTKMHTLNLGILAGLLGFLAHSFVDTNFYTLQLPALFWCFVGLAISLDRVLRDEEKCVIT